ncbi:discoidin domain-containing protein [Oecophyllibacter saccharovorans]|uniref:discoidin domain-containing protein n=1 Tax=Oecophyllibacter saccharovorans TaxID=2558360 RepID=UPI0011413C75|nr:discoidin domain-containing protein [Oecophyllibacter saccharovorans]QDH15503.1 discoidin domain-containing protein [Oecophyllibacter saccharovorans]
MMSDQSLPAETVEPKKDNVLEAEEVIEVGRYLLSHYPINPESVVVVFASAGARLAGGLEEFKGSLRRFGISMLFVRDKDASYYQEPEVEEMFRKVAEMVQPYKNVAVMGESMGGSGALIFPRYCDKVDRTLAFSPLYSFGFPYNRFNGGWANERIPRLWAFDSDDMKARASSVLIYGVRPWQDMPHAGMFALQGYQVLMVKECGHQVAGHLKKGTDTNYLIPLLERFLDFSAEFNEEGVRPLLAPVLTVLGREEKEWKYEGTMKREHTRVGMLPLPPIPEGLVDLGQGRPADQSSLSDYSKAPTTQEDAARALMTETPEFYAFHTNLENQPWWMVDLGEGAKVEEVRIYNRIDNNSVERGLRFAIETLVDGEWQLLFEKNNYKLFGGIDGHPFSWRPEQPMRIRKLRIRSLEDENFMHYQKIEVLGKRRVRATVFTPVRKIWKGLFGRSSRK